MYPQSYRRSGEESHDSAPPRQEAPVSSRLARREAGRGLVTDSDSPMALKPAHPGVLFLCSMVLLACGKASPGESACDGLSDRRMGITREEYLPCAGEIIGALDTLRVQLDAILDGDTTILARARDTSRELNARIRETGIDADYRSLRAGTVVERWPDGDLRAFNHSVFDAAFHYSTFLAGRSDRTAYRFEEGIKAHEQARDAYRQID